MRHPIGKALLFVFAAVGTLAAAAAVPADYATQWPLSLGRDDGGAYRVVLDQTVYRQLQDPQLRDLVVLDRDGRPVPADVLAPENALAKPPQRIAVPWFALPAARTDGVAQGWELISQADSDGRLRRVEARITEQGAAALPRTP